ncbi:MAG TPA: hypothetical protein VIY52_32105 [Streptosporangiaceae bacterium]
MGITDDRSRAMRAGEESLGSGQAVVVIIEAVRTAMAPQTLAPCYVRTGMGWLGWCTYTGEVSWDRFFAPVDRAAPSRTGPPGFIGAASRKSSALSPGPTCPNPPSPRVSFAENVSGMG